MSLSIAFYKEGHFSCFLKLKVARSRVRKGTHRWRQLAFEREIEEIPAKPVQPRGDYSPNGHYRWNRGESGLFVVMKAKRVA